MPPMTRWLALAGLALPAGAGAQDFTLHGYLDYRLVSRPDEPSYVEGGPGKTRFGGGGTGGEFGGAALAASAQLAPAWLARVDVQFQTTDESSVDVLEAWTRWRPVSLTPWRHSFKFGAFFAPISLENDGIAWTSRWTLTPSAVNTWVGEELRTVGAEYRIEHRADGATVEGAVALYGWNDPAGEILAARGWAMSDLYVGLGGSLREPDVVAIAQDEPVPRRYDPYVEIDDRIGWYAEGTVRAPGRGRFTALYYDNNADGTTSTTYEGSEISTWDTRFWSLAGEASIGPVTLIGQAMTGSTYFAPSPFFSSTTEFDAGFLLAGWDLGRWRPAARVDLFTTRERPRSGSPVDEHGHALTLALNWRPRDWLRVSAEWLHIDSTRGQPIAELPDERIVANQFQLGARILF